MFRTKLTAGAQTRQSFCLIINYIFKTIMKEESPPETVITQQVKISAITCRIAVKNPWGLKKPVIQKQWGRSLKTQEVNWQFLSISSVNQKPKVLETQDAWNANMKTWINTGLILLCNWLYPQEKKKMKYQFHT